MNPTNVNPAAWSDHEVIFDDLESEYSALWGKYQGKLCLGTRWNGPHEERGYPGQGQYPLWFVEPDFLTLAILQRLFIEAMKSRLQDTTGGFYSDKIAKAIQQYLDLTPNTK